MLLDWYHSLVIPINIFKLCHSFYVMSMILLPRLDPIRSFTGHEKYKRRLWATSALDNPPVVSLISCLPWFDSSSYKHCCWKLYKQLLNHTYILVYWGIIISFNLLGNRSFSTLFYCCCNRLKLLIVPTLNVAFA